jgi:hypothetical protein
MIHARRTTSHNFPTDNNHVVSTVHALMHLLPQESLLEADDHSWTGRLAGARQSAYGAFCMTFA